VIRPTSHGRGTGGTNLTDNDADLVDVTVVGYGPVGQVTAAMLGQRGYRVVVFERWPELYGRARAGHLDHEAMRIVQSIGVADAIESLASRPTAYEFRSAEHELLMSLDWNREEVSGWASDYFIYQPDIEDAFSSRVSTLPNVEVFMGYEVDELTQTADAVSITAARFQRDADGNRIATPDRRHVRSRYVIGADGANSYVRRSLGITTTDLGFDEKWAVYDISPFETLPLAYNDAQVCDPQRPRCLWRLGERRQRFEFMLRPGDDEKRLAAADGAWELMGLFDVTPEQATLDRAAVYEFRSLIADQWRVGRVLLAGDAAHLMPPFMGQGMISGIRDAVSLEWRLDLVLSGTASDRLLDSYQVERQPHVTEIIRQSVAAGEAVCIVDPEAARLRDEAFRSGEFPPPAPLPALRGGALADPPDALTGKLAPQGRIEHGGRVARFDDVHGSGWILLARADVDVALGPAEEALLRDLGGRVVRVGEAEDIEGDYREFFAVHDVAAILYRPDFRIFGAAPDARDAPSLLVRLRDRLAAIGAVDRTLVGRGAIA
jgi:2-polyprenyl-6-methoxyphenol hydroxylase-like FAD-dependent oxidoreductase